MPQPTPVRQVGEKATRTPSEHPSVAHQLPHREKYLLLATKFLRRLLQLHLDLVDEVERELARSVASKSRP
jgi:hypothetical protein